MWFKTSRKNNHNTVIYLNADYEKQKFTLKLVNSIHGFLLLGFAFMHAGLLPAKKNSKLLSTLGLEQYISVFVTRVAGSTRS